MKTQGFSSFFTENCERESRMHLRKDTTSKACPAGNLAGALLQSTISRLFSAFSWGPDGEALYLYFSSLRRVLSFYLYNWYPRFSLIIQYKSFFYCTFSFCQGYDNKTILLKVENIFCSAPLILHTDYFTSQQLIIKLSVILDFLIYTYLRPQTQEKNANGKKNCES